MYSEFHPCSSSFIGAQLIEVKKIHVFRNILNLKNFHYVFQKARNLEQKFLKRILRHFILGTLFYQHQTEPDQIRKGQTLALICYLLKIVMHWNPELIKPSAVTWSYVWGQAIERRTISKREVYHHVNFSMNPPSILS